MRYLTAADIIKNTGIEVIWIEKEYTEEGSYIPKCSLFRMEQ